MRALSDTALLRRLSEVIHQLRRVEADIVALIAEVDARKLYTREAAPSMFAYCTEVLHLSEHEAYLRITVARASREHPVLMDMLRDGRLHLAAIARLVPHLTESNRDSVLRRAVHKSKRQVEELVAELTPRPDAPARMRKLPSPRPETRPAPTARLGPDRVEAAPSELGPDRVAAAPREGMDALVAASPAPPDSRPSVVEPLAPARYRVQFTASAELHDKLERLQALMGASVPDGDLGAVIEAAVTEKLERLEAKRFARTKAPRRALADTEVTPKSRHIPAAIRRAVHERDGGRCTYEDARGRRCTARRRLEFHHHGTPFGRGGDHSLRNLRLMCHPHNQLLAEQEYGKEKMARYRRGQAAGTQGESNGRASGVDTRSGAAAGTAGVAPGVAPRASSAPP